MVHHACKTYFNIHVKTKFEKLDAKGIVIIVDYKMKILPISI